MLVVVIFLSIGLKKDVLKIGNHTLLLSGHYTPKVFQIQFFPIRSLLTPRKGSLQWKHTGQNQTIPAARSRHTGTSVASQNTIYFVGGNQGDERFNEICNIDPNNQLFTTISNVPSMPMISRHSACLINDKIWVFGGSITVNDRRDSSNFAKVNTLYSFDIVTKIWTTHSIENNNNDNDNKNNSNDNNNNNKNKKELIIPPPRSDHSACAVGNCIYVFGGSSTEVTPMSDFWEFNTVTMKWRDIGSIAIGSVPPPRSGHSMISIGNLVCVFGGAVWSKAEGWKSHYNDLHVFDTGIFILLLSNLLYFIIFYYLFLILYYFYFYFVLFYFIIFIILYFLLFFLYFFCLQGKMFRRNVSI